MIVVLVDQRYANTSDGANAIGEFQGARLLSLRKVAVARLANN
jgi:hypothetical protein